MIILDSSVWVAFFNKEDSQHKKAVQTLKKYRRGLLVTEYILLETSSVLCIRADKTTADKFLKMMMNNRDIKIMPAGKYFLNKVVKEFLIYKEKFLSFTDVSLMHLAKQHEIITFDKKLAKAIKNIKI